jgi:predicted Zn-dependent protease
VTQAEATNVVPKKVQVVTVARGDTVASLARRMAYPAAQEERFRVLNALSSGAQVTPGQKVKIVVRAR